VQAAAARLLASLLQQEPLLEQQDSQQRRMHRRPASLTQQARVCERVVVGESNAWLLSWRHVPAVCHRVALVSAASQEGGEGLAGISRFQSRWKCVNEGGRGGMKEDVMLCIMALARPLLLNRLLASAC
jgi:hypothetical protein